MIPSTEYSGEDEIMTLHFMFLLQFTCWRFPCFAVFYLFDVILFNVCFLSDAKTPVPIPMLFTLKSQMKDEVFLPATRDVFVCCVRTMAVSQKKVS